ncbi:MAG: hypothetical protein PVF74_09220 [Anaerolineales bacterium]
MARIADDFLTFYSQPGVMTELGSYAHMLGGLPNDLKALCRVVQGNLIHVFWAERYGVKLSEEEQSSVQIRPVSEKLARIWEKDNQPLSEIRPLEGRQAGNCRDFSLLLCAILYHQGVSARARCGFGVYFLPDHFEDHWICEYWNDDQERWVMVDSQLDSFQRQALDIQFDPLDVPHDQFISAGRAWQMCRYEGADPSKFGIMDMHGMWFIWGNVVRDFLALNKIEILPWDWGWSYMTKRLDDSPPEENQMGFYDEIAALTLVGNDRFQEVRRTYIDDKRWQPPAEVAFIAA